MAKYKVIKGFWYPTEIGEYVKDSRSASVNDETDFSHYKDDYINFLLKDGYIEEMKEPTEEEERQEVINSWVKRQETINSWTGIKQSALFCNKYQAMELYDNIVKELNGDWVADLDNDEQRKYCIVLSNRCFDLSIHTSRRESPLEHAKSTEIVRSILDNENMKPYLKLIFPEVK